MILATGLMPGLAAAETAETIEAGGVAAEMTRRAVSMTSDSGKAITAEQVYVTMRRRDGTPIEAETLPSYVRFAERAACGDRAVLVSVIVGAIDGAGQFEVLCAAGN